MAQPRWRQVYERIVAGIRDGTYPAGTLLPSHRTMAAEHHVAYSTVMRAVIQLQHEGWIDGEPGVGLRVREDHPD
jgi:DNA-binding GntR family transcriptional regulator